VEWAIMSPNVMVEFDVLPYNWSKWTVALGGRYNDFAKDILSRHNIPVLWKCNHRTKVQI